MSRKRTLPPRDRAIVVLRKRDERTLHRGDAQPVLVVVGGVRGVVAEKREATHRIDDFVGRKALRRRPVADGQLSGKELVTLLKHLEGVVVRVTEEDGTNLFTSCEALDELDPAQKRPGPSG